VYYFRLFSSNLEANQKKEDAELARMAGTENIQNYYYNSHPAISEANKRSCTCFYFMLHFLVFFFFFLLFFLIYTDVTEFSLLSAAVAQCHLLQQGPS